MESALDIDKAIQLIKRNIKYLILIPILFMTIAIALTLIFINPKQEVTAQILVNEMNVEELDMAERVKAHQQIISTYTEIIKSPRILKKVNEALDNKYDSDKLREKVNVTSRPDSKVLNINVEDDKEKDAKKIANTIAETFTNEINKIADMAPVSLLSEAERLGKKKSVNVMKNAALGLFFGLAFSLVFILLKDILQNRVWSKHSLERLLNNKTRVTEMYSEDDIKRLYSELIIDLKKHHDNRIALVSPNDTPYVQKLTEYLQRDKALTFIPVNSIETHTDVPLTLEETTSSILIIDDKNNKKDSIEEAINLIDTHSKLTHVCLIHDLKEVN